MSQDVRDLVEGGKHRWLSVWYRKLTWISALAGVSQRATLLALDLGNSGMKTTATPQAAQMMHSCSLRYGPVFRASRGLDR
jgi:hypothetical protein